MDKNSAHKNKPCSRYPLPKGQKKVWEEEVLPNAATAAAAASAAAAAAAGGGGGAAEGPDITGAAFNTGEDQSEEDKLKVGTFKAGRLCF